MTRSGTDLLRGTGSGGVSSSDADGGVTFTIGAAPLAPGFLSLADGL